MENSNGTIVDFIISDRRDALHLAPVVNEMRQDTGLVPRVTVVTSGNDCLTHVLSSLDLAPDVQWKVHGSENNPSLFHAEVLVLLGEFWNSRKPKWLMSFGHSEFTFACLFSAFQNEIPIAHMLDMNSIDESEPHRETSIHKRRLVNSMSSVHFTPNTHCKNLLLADGIEERRIFSVGSPLIVSGRIISSSDLFTSGLKNFATDSPQIAKIVGSHFVLIELQGKYHDSERLIAEVRRLVLTNSVTRFILLDLKSEKRDAFTEILSPYNLMTIDKVGHLARCFLYAKAAFVLSDSVDVLEECAGYGTKGILLQKSTMRLDLVSSGWITLANSFSEELDKKFQSFLVEGKTISAQLPLKSSEGYPIGASRRIVAALTNRTSESVQKLKTSPQLQRAQ
jgi:UDP-N-acetylglucosamine 2-epimerase (non-hydrolysing)